jgi:small-conductance mechanosensitive channel
MNDYLEILFTLTQNTVFQAGLYVIGSLVTAKLADWIITSILSRLASRTDSTIDDRIIQILHRPIYYSILFVGLGISITLLQLPDIITFVFIGIFKSMAILIWSLALFQAFMHFINWYNQQNKGKSILQTHTLPLFDNVGKVIIFMVAVYFIFISWGFNVTGWLASTTIVAMVVALAAKDTVANLFAGFFIMADTPYKLGDYINLDGGERGYVKHIGLRSTRIMTRDDIEITLPNSLIANSKIINESGGPKEKERVRITLSVAYGSDIDQVRSTLMEIAQNNENVCKNPEPRMRFRNFGDSGITLQLLFWIEKPEDRGRITDELNTAIYKQFIKENIVIPYPQRTIHVKTQDSLKISK